MEIGGSTSSIQAIQNAFDANAARAKRISSQDGGPQFEKDMAELPNDPEQVGMQTKAIKAKDQMLGTLLDMVA
jgi:hypothetical protein